MLITEDIISRAKELVTFAQEHPFTLDDLKAMVAGTFRLLPPGKRAEYHMHIPNGYKAVYTWEQQPDPLGWCIHVSFSVDTPGLMPSPEAVDELLKLFEIDKNHSQADHGYIEDLEEGFQAVNLMFKT